MKDKAEIIFKNKEFYATILNSIINGVWVTDKDDIIFYANKGMGIIAGIPNEKLVGAHVLIDFSEDTIKHFLPYYLKAKETLQRVYYEAVSVVTPSGRQSYQSGWLIPRVIDGMFNGMICTAEEITERKKVEEELLIFKRFAETSNLGYGFADLNGDIIYTNSYLCRMLGEEEPKNALGKNVSIYYPDDLKPVLLNEILLTVKSTGSWIGELPLMSIKGDITPAIQNISLIRDDSGKPFYIGNVITDITERKKAEQEHKRLNRELAQKNRELEQIIYVTSHDLRSPLINVDGYSKELEYSIKELKDLLCSKDVPLSIREKIAHVIEEDIPESLHYISNSISKMDALLAGMSMLLRTGRVELIIEDIDMNEIIADVISNNQLRLKDAGIKSEISSLPACKGDKNQINQVFSNLIDNAVNYLDSNRTGIIKISGNKERDKSVYCVEDNGVGIAPEHQKKIFNIFHRLNPGRVKGEGLGLTIVQTIIDRHKGMIWVESEIGKGSRFFVSISS